MFWPMRYKLGFRGKCFSSNISTAYFASLQLLLLIWNMDRMPGAMAAILQPWGKSQNREPQEPCLWCCWAMTNATFFQTSNWMTRQRNKQTKTLICTEVTISEFSVMQGQMKSLTDIPAKQSTEEGAFQAEEMTCPKTLRHEWAWHV